MIVIPMSFDKNDTNHDPNSTPGKMQKDVITLSDGAQVENTPEAVHAHNEMSKRSAEAARQQYNRQQQARETGKRCPFHPDAHVNSNIPCKKDCALYLGDSCALAASPGKVDTNGKPCPFRRRCDPACALYNGAGCSLTNLATMAERI